MSAEPRPSYSIGPFNNPLGPSLYLIPWKLPLNVCAADQFDVKAHAVSESPRIPPGGGQSCSTSVH
jgi:hypothetical protein